MTEPTNSGAPGVGTGGDLNTQLTGCAPILGASPSERERRARLARLAQQADRRRATHALDALLANMYPSTPRTHMSEAWERNNANDLAAQGFDPEYIARHYGLTMRRAA